MRRLGECRNGKKGRREEDVISLPTAMQTEDYRCRSIWTNMTFRKIKSIMNSGRNENAKLSQPDKECGKKRGKPGSITLASQSSSLEWVSDFRK